MRKLILSLFCCLSMGAFAASNFQISNAELSQRPANGRLGDAVQAAQKDGADYVGYSLPARPGQTVTCRVARGGTRLSGGRGVTVYGQEGLVDGMPNRTGVTRFGVFMRMAGTRVAEIRLLPVDCDIDGEGARVCLITNVTPADSADYLNGLIDLGEDPGEDAMTALALQAGSEADAVLWARAEAGNPGWVREKATFWLASSRGESGYQLVARLLQEETDRDLREHLVFCLHISEVPEARTTMMDLARHADDAAVRGKAVFWLGQKGGDDVVALIHEILTDARDEDLMDDAVMALSLLPNDAGVPVLVTLAREGAHRQVREKALFWLGQKAGDKAVATLRDVVDHDPDLDLKKRAVFALSQLPESEAVPQLVRLARTHAQPEVRKQALFWLGQTGSPEALALFEEILD